MLDIAAEALTKDFGTIRAVDDVGFEIQPGRVVGLLGPNGSGMTTTLRMLLGLVSPTAGRAMIGGRAFAALNDPAHQVGVMLEAGAFHRGRTARNHLRVLLLSSVTAADFVFLQRTTGLTKGNLCSHLTKLEQAGLVEIEKRFIHKKPNTNVALTSLGRRRIAHHWDQLERLKRLIQTPDQKSVS
jgi:ABC-type branched-subunit amino acid transport system ATPase component